VLLDENAIVEAVCAYFEREGFAIVSRCTTSQQGIDIVAECSGNRWLVEAKGATSSRRGSARFDVGFSSSQAFDRVAKGVYTALELNEGKSVNDVVALAFQKLPTFEKYVTRASKALKQLDIAVFWVGDDGHVSLDR
jgi:Holliday junction resolvase-like predicted endonuclease